MDNKPENRFDGKMDTPKKLSYMLQNRLNYVEKLVELQPNLRLE